MRIFAKWFQDGTFEFILSHVGELSDCHFVSLGGVGIMLLNLLDVLLIDGIAVGFLNLGISLVEDLLELLELRLIDGVLRKGDIHCSDRSSHENKREFELHKRYYIAQELPKHIKEQFCRVGIMIQVLRKLVGDDRVVCIMTSWRTQLSTTLDCSL